MGHRDRVVFVGVCVALAVFAGRPPVAGAQIVKKAFHEPQPLDAAIGAGSALRGLLAESSGFFEGDNEALRGLFRAQSTTFPVGSSAGGFSWTFDSQLGVPTRQSQTFGPVFAERPLTTGRYRLNVSLAYQRTTWKSVAGFNLADGLPFSVDDFFEQERIEQRSVIRLTTQQTIAHASFGLTDRIDIGVIVPYVRQTVAGELRTVCTSVPSDRLFCDSSVPRSGSSSGVGDVTIRGKIVLPVNLLDLAAGVDVRLPTGDELNLLGAGRTQTTAMLFGGGKGARITPHFNVGYTFGGGGLPDIQGFRLEQGDFRPSNEFKYTIGTEFLVSTPITIAGDIIGRTMFHAPVPFFAARPSGGFVVSGLRISRSTLNLMVGAVSAKVMLANSWLLTGAVAFPLNSNGLRPGITPVIGFERAF